MATYLFQIDEMTKSIEIDTSVNCDKLVKGLIWSSTPVVWYLWNLQRSIMLNADPLTTFNLTLAPLDSKAFSIIICRSVSV
jgi:hypothetical protein